VTRRTTEAQHLSGEGRRQIFRQGYATYLSLLRGHTYSREIPGTRDDIRSVTLASTDEKSVGSYYLASFFPTGRAPVYADIRLFHGRSGTDRLWIRAKSDSERRKVAQLLVGEMRLPGEGRPETTLHIRLYRHIQILWPAFVVVAVALFILAALLLSNTISSTSHPGVGFGVLAIAIILSLFPASAPFSALPT
jgi:hypothetical protein